MTITQERANILSDFLSADDARAEKLLAMDSEQAVKEINAEGHDFTVDELKEFGSLLRVSVGQKVGAELNANDLDAVAGGVNILIEGNYIEKFKIINKEYNITNTTLNEIKANVFNISAW